MKKFLILLLLSIATIITILFGANKLIKSEYTLQPNLELDTQGAMATVLTDITVHKYYDAIDVVFAINYRGGKRSNEEFEIRPMRFEQNGSGGYFPGIEKDVNED